MLVLQPFPLEGGGHVFSWAAVSMADLSSFLSEHQAHLGT